MKKYILKEQKTLENIINKLLNKPVQSVHEDSKPYIITKINLEKDLNNTVTIIIEPIENAEMGKPVLLMTVVKDNKVEIRIKQESPYRDDLYIVQEVIIEPLERSAVRATIRNIKLLNLHYTPQIDLTSVLSLYGKTSIITQTIQKFQAMLESALNQFGYFITKVRVGFYYAADTPLLNALADSKASYFLRDAYKKQFYTERAFFNPVAKFKPQNIDAIVQNLLLDNVKSVLIIPFFGTGNALLGYVELFSSLPNLGNDHLQNDIESPMGIGQLISFISSRCEDFTFELELSYVKEWKMFTAKEDAIDISQDGRGLGIFLSQMQDYTFLETGCKIAFSIPINKKHYLFYASVKNVKKQKSGDNIGTSLGVRIYSCDQPEGVNLLSTYATQLITKNLI